MTCLYVCTCIHFITVSPPAVKYFLLLLLTNACSFLPSVCFDLLRFCIIFLFPFGWLLPDLLNLTWICGVLCSHYYICTALGIFLTLLWLLHFMLNFKALRLVALDCLMTSRLKLFVQLIKLPLSFAFMNLQSPFLHLQHNHISGYARPNLRKRTA